MATAVGLDIQNVSISEMPMNSRDILERLVAFKTVSRDTNLDLIDYVRTFLVGVGARCQLYHRSRRTQGEPVRHDWAK